MEWADLGSSSTGRRFEGIIVRGLGAGWGRAGFVWTMIGLTAYLLSRHPDCMYIDEWLVYRSSPFRRLLIQATARALGVKTVLDQRDPYIDHEIARGQVREGTFRHRLLVVQYRIIYRLCDLVVLPSSIYADSYASEGVPRRKLLGTLRGVDGALFNPRADGAAVRAGLHIEGKFVIGWFGMMLPYRQVDDVLVPLVKGMGERTTDTHFLIGGSGQMKKEIVRLRSEAPDAPFTFLGFVPYEELPSYLAACDLLLCPLDPGFRFTQHSAWLKILEALGVGRPIVATRTRLADGDYKDLKGVVWTGGDSSSFLDAILRASTPTTRAMPSSPSGRQRSSASTRLTPRYRR